MKNIFKCLAWVVILFAISLAMAYGLWLILIFMLFEETLLMVLTIAGEILLAAIWWWIVDLAAC